jgi:hypothetical protein
MLTNPKGRTWSRIALSALIAAGFSAVPLVHAGSSGVCVTVDVDRPVVLPEIGTVPAGRLMLCDSVEYSPVATLHKTYLDGKPVGILLSRKRTGEGKPVAEPRVLFRADGTGKLELIGYVLPGRTGSVAFLLGERPSIKDTEAVSLVARR